MDNDNNVTEEINYPFEKIREKVFNGNIPIKIVIAKEDKLKIPNTIDYEPIYYINIPRCSYLPIYTTEIANYFIKRKIIENENDIWFSYNDIPLKWYYIN
ncbi:hypothetical protein BCR36DRAFT_187958 [Piromyces finnis]|uniref:Autophagy protein ATG5 UblA domain-containing protein n=1 Tax=Piromyces finnis TaxID=1754191 RepID=A0A1Y1VGI1_9FUNG|nr:hypothetical protein BCR36DRAFT_187958 [Piromyces finnis]|eukprot:ORX55518.1 hypothetical protein BCR36DRAFT_187958 [Piromyces finnis]